MILSGDWTRNHTKLIGGLRMLARFLSGNVEFFDDGQAEVFVLEKDRRPVARLEIGPGLDVRLVSIRIFDWKGSVDAIIARVLKQGQAEIESDDAGGEA